MQNPRTITGEVSQIIKAPERLTVFEMVDKYGLVLDIPGKPRQQYDTKLTYYMREPTDCMTMRKYSEVIFVGPAQSGKTQAIVELMLAYIASCNPIDMMIVEKDQNAARAFVMLKLNRMIAANPWLAKLIASKQSDTLTDKTFISGMVSLIGWPSKNQLAGRPLAIMISTDSDRVPGDIGGEGSLFSQMGERAKSFGSRKKIVAESSPAKPSNDPSWEPPNGNRHIGPPCDGIIGLYNQGDRRRLYGKCPDCGDYMLPLDGRDGFTEDGHLICTANGCGIEAGTKWEREFKRSGLWVGDGQVVDGGHLIGNRINTNRASFWMQGVFAAFQTWGGLLDTYKKAYGTFLDTGSEDDLKNCVNSAFSGVFIPIAQRSGRRKHTEFMERAEAVEKYVVPSWCRALFAAVDIQGWGFEVLILGVGANFETSVVARFGLRKSTRPDGKGGFLDMKPASYLEDFDVLEDRVINSSYKVQGSDLELRIYRTAIDLHGSDGVSKNVYSWWRGLSHRGNPDKPSTQQRVKIVRGAPGTGKQLVTKSFPDTAEKGGASIGDVPVFHLQSNEIKDVIWNSLHRDQPGPSYIHFPDYMREDHYKELTVENRDEKGKWTCPPGKRNETFDLLCYCYALWVILGGVSINYANPPTWFNEIDKNSETTTAMIRKAKKIKEAEKRRAMESNEPFGPEVNF